MDMGRPRGSSRTLPWSRAAAGCPLCLGPLGSPVWALGCTPAAGARGLNFDRGACRASLCLNTFHACLGKFQWQTSTSPSSQWQAGVRTKARSQLWLQCSGMKSVHSHESHQIWPAPSGCIMGAADQFWHNPEEVSQHQIPFLAVHKGPSMHPPVALRMQQAWPGIPCHWAATHGWLAQVPP